MRKDVFVFVMAALAVWWAASPVASQGSQSYAVQPGDTLAGVSRELGIPVDELVSWNVKQYPEIADHRLFAEWKLHYEGVSSKSRLDALITGWAEKILQEEPELPFKYEASFHERIRRKNEEFALGIVDPVRAQQRIGARGDAECANGWVHYKTDIPELYLDPALMYLAQMRTEIRAGVSKYSLEDFPLCEGCREMVFTEAACDALYPFHDNDQLIGLSQGPQQWWAIDVVRQPNWQDLGVGLWVRPNQHVTDEGAVTSVVILR